jgi:hypothetical protein
MPRIKREDPERVDPIRAWETLFRRDDSQPEPGAAEGSSSAGEKQNQKENANDDASWNDIATRAVRRGYEVIEEQINEGRRIAEKVRGYSDDVRKGTDDTTRLIERSLRFYTDVGSLWFELVESLLRNQALNPDARRSGHGNGTNGSSPHAANGNGASGAASTEFDIEVISSCPTTVSFDLRSASGAALAVPALRAADETKPPMTDIGFHAREGRTVLRIKVPKGQPADTYSGVVVDAATHQPRGTLCVSVRDEAAPA